MRRAWCVVRGLPGWRTFDVAQDVLFRHATGVAAAGDPRDVDAVLGSDLADEGRRFRAEALLGGLDTSIAVAFQRGSRRRSGWWRWRSFGWLGSGRRGGLRRLRFRGRRSGGRFRCHGASFGLEHRDQRLHRHGLSFLHLDLGQDARGRRRNLGVDLVRRDLEQRLVALHGIAHLLEPFAQGAFGDRFAHLRHQHVYACHVFSKAVSGARCLVSEMPQTPGT